MYDELVKLARYCAEKDACINCPVGGCQGTTGIMNLLADAIEERDRYALTLQHEMMAEAESHIALVERLNKQIEELSKFADAIPHVCECCIGCEVESGGCDRGFILSPKRAREYLSKPRWIPVTERLPEESEGLDWHEGLMIRFTSVWCFDVKTGTIEVRNRYQGKMTGNESLDQYTEDTDWHWSKSWWEPTHWMPRVPLPEPPEEEV